MSNLDGSQVGLVRLDRSAERKLRHAGKVFVGISSSDEPFNLALPESPTQFSAQGGFNDCSSAGLAAGRHDKLGCSSHRPLMSVCADNVHCRRFLNVEKALQIRGIWQMPGTVYLVDNS